MIFLNGYVLQKIAKSSGVVILTSPRDIRTFCYPGLLDFVSCRYDSRIEDFAVLKVKCVGDIRRFISKSFCGFVCISVNREETDLGDRSFAFRLSGADRDDSNV